ncbi:MAG: SURF1 family protein [Nevskiales bacterium]
MSWSFRPALWSIAGTVAGCALTVHLGIWQLNRGAEKKALDAQYAAAAQLPPVELKAATAAPAHLAATAVTAHGTWLAERQLLLDDQVHADMPGYNVWTPLRLGSGGVVIVNRGWVPHGPNRHSLPPLPVPEGEVSVQGLWRSLPEPGIRLGDSGCTPDKVSAEWPRLVLYPTAKDLDCFYGEPVMAGEILLAPDAPDGYVREWRVSSEGFPPARHYAYAAQWFAFALTLLVIFIKLNLKRKP